MKVKQVRPDGFVVAVYIFKASDFSEFGFRRQEIHRAIKSGKLYAGHYWLEVKDIP